MIIVGNRVVLRDEKRETDVEDRFRWLNLSEWQYYDEPDAKFRPMSRSDFDARVATPTQPDPTKGRREIDTLEARHIGWVNYYTLDPDISQVYVGIVLPEEDTWNQGFGTEALRLWIAFLFRESGLAEIKLATWSGNTRMIGCALKCGFREVARLPHRATHSVRGESMERVEFSLSRSEWLTAGLSR